MSKISRSLLLIAGVSLMLAGVLGAYGFHGLPGKVPDAKLDSWNWANAMQFYHSMGLILIGLLLDRAPRSILLRLAAGLMIVGLILFSANIYIEILVAPSVLGNLAPAGGTSFMVAWLLTGIGAFRIQAVGRP